LDQDPTLPPAELVPPPEASPGAQPSALRKLFIGKDGLRAGWGLLIFIAILVALAFSVNRIAHKLYPASPSGPTPRAEITPSFIFIAESVPFLLVFLVTWIMSKIEHRPNSVYGFGGSHKFSLFVKGLGWGVFCLSLLILILRGAGLLVIDHRLLFGSNVLRYGAIWLFGFLLVGLFEEYLVRGYLQYTLTRGLAGLYQLAFKTRHSTALGFWTSAVIFSVLFGLGHGNNPGESPIGLFGAGLAGLIFCLSLWRTGSLWWAIGFHAGWDWSQSFLYGVADSGMMAQHHLLATHPVGKPFLSGGATGPEGSVYMLAVMGLACLIIIFTLPRTRLAQATEVSLGSTLANSTPASGGA
jgi:membrane protease YdiL (CAAX protease family)